MRILAIDYGEKRLGLAISDPTGTIALGLPTLARIAKTSHFQKLTELVEREQVEEVVVGFPRNMNGTIGDMARAAKTFADSLRSHLRVPVSLWDERLTTKSAERSLVDAGVTFRKRKSRIDMVAAQILLQSYLEYRRRMKEKKHTD